MTCTETRKIGLIREMRTAARALEHQPHPSVTTTLTDLIDGALRLLAPAQHAGITLTAGREVRTACTSGPYPTLLDQIQKDLNQGPCLTAARDQHTVRITDMGSDPRWKAYRRAALHHTPVRSVLSLEINAEPPYTGALNLFAEHTNAFDTESEDLGAIYATYVGMAWAFARHSHHFEQALASRDTIGQAKGMIMQRYKVDADQAFQLLRRLSQTSNTPLARVAAQLIEAERAIIKEPEENP